MSKPTRARAVQIHRYPIWPPKSSLLLFKTIRNVGDRIKKENPNFISFVIVGSRTKGYGVARRKSQDSRGHVGASDIDVYSIVKTSENRPDDHMMQKELEEAVAKIQERARQPIKVQLCGSITDYWYKQVPEYTALLFFLATHKDINKARMEAVEHYAKHDPENWPSVIWHHDKWYGVPSHMFTVIRGKNELHDKYDLYIPEEGDKTHRKYLNLVKKRARFSLPPLEQMPAWLTRFEAQRKEHEPPTGN